MKQRMQPLIPRTRQQADYDDFTKQLKTGLHQKQPNGCSVRKGIIDSRLPHSVRATNKDAESAAIKRNGR